MRELLTRPKGLFHHAQEEAFDVLTRADGGLLWHKPGEGKTRVGLFASLQITLREKFKVILFVCRRIGFYDLRAELQRCKLDLEVIELEALSPKHKFKKPTIIFMSWARWRHDMYFDILFQHFPEIGCMVLDEGYLYKNPQSATCEMAAKLGTKIPSILMSGSIMPAKDITDIYGQALAIGRGSTLAKNLSDFRQQFLLGLAGGYAAGGLSWHPKKGAYKRIIELISGFTHIHIPPDDKRQIKIAIKKVPATEQQLKYFRELKTYATIEDKLEVNHQGAVVIKAQQISNGWLRRDDGEIEHFESSKIRATVAWCDELFNAGQNKLVIWCAFKPDLDRLEDELAPHFCNVVILKLKGGMKFDIEKWKKSNAAICLATMASGTTFNHFGQVPYGLYFSQDWKWLSLDQSQRRHVRKDSKHDAAHFTFLHTEGSMDAQVHYGVKSAAAEERSFIRQLEVDQWLRS